MVGARVLGYSRRAPLVPGRSSPQPLSCPQDLVGQNEWLQRQLLRLLVVHNDAATIARCALDLSLPISWLPAAAAAELGQLQMEER